MPKYKLTNEGQWEKGNGSRHGSTYLCPQHSVAEGRCGNLSLHLSVLIAGTWTMDQRKIGGGELSCAVRTRFPVWNCPIGWKSWVVRCAFWQQTRLPYKNSPLDVTKSSAVPAMHLYHSIGDRAWSICLRWCWCLPSISDEMKWRQVGIFNSPEVSTG